MEQLPLLKKPLDHLGKQVGIPGSFWQGRMSHRETGNGTTEQAMAEPCWTIRATTPDDGLGALVERETNSATSGSASRGRGQGAGARWTLGERSAGHRVGFDLGLC